MCFYDPENIFVLLNIIKIHTFGNLLMWTTDQSNWPVMSSAKGHEQPVPLFIDKNKKRIIQHLGKILSISEQTLSWGMGTPQRMFLIKQSTFSLSHLFFLITKHLKYVWSDRKRACWNDRGTVCDGERKKIPPTWFWQQNSPLMPAG